MTLCYLNLQSLIKSASTAGLSFLNCLLLQVKLDWMCPFRSSVLKFAWQLAFTFLRRDHFLLQHFTTWQLRTCFQRLIIEKVIPFVAKKNVFTLLLNERHLYSFCWDTVFHSSDVWEVKLFLLSCYTWYFRFSWRIFNFYFRPKPRGNTNFRKFPCNFDHSSISYPGKARRDYRSRPSRHQAVRYIYLTITTFGSVSS